MELLHLQNLTFTYPNQEKPTVRDVDLVLRSGEFVVLAGESGCGKSTLLRQCKTDLAPHGKLQGQVIFQGKTLQELDRRTQSACIGFVQQDPDSQIVTDKVWHEMAFGLENLGLDTATIRGAVAEMASYFGISDWFYQPVSQLSGGQKQLLNLASVMVMEPQLLILDEPTSQLDPIAAADFLATLGRINRELGTTILLTEHRLEDAIPLASRIVVLDKGQVLCDGTAQSVFQTLRSRKHPMLQAMPAPMRIWASLPGEEMCPMTVAQGRMFLTNYSQSHELKPVPETCHPRLSAEPVLRLKEIWFRYEQNSEDILKGLELEAYPGELLCILGTNGVGKSTALGVISGVKKAYRGKRQVKGKLAALPQDPNMLLVKETLRQDILAAAGEKKQEAMALCSRLGIGHLLDHHPYDLSGGEQQKAALAKVLLSEPDILLLDEPTKGLDAAFKEELGGILAELKAQGVCIVMVSHDVEFCAAYGHRCTLLFDGAIVTGGNSRDFFAGMSFYTTTAHRMSKHVLDKAVTAEDVILSCGGQVPDKSHQERLEIPEQLPPLEKPKLKLPLWRRILAGVSGVVALGAFGFSASRMDLNSLFTSENYRASTQGFSLVYLIVFAALMVMAFALAPREEKKAGRLLTGRLSIRTKLAMAVCLLAIPLTVLCGAYWGGDRKYLIISMLVLIEAMLPFFLSLEGRKPQARELAILAVLCALGIAARAAFFVLPGFKPVAALTIIVGIAFGGEAGFLAGAVTMMGSNVLFGQGPWTPWQMFAMGVIGLVSGVLARKGILSQRKGALSLFGLLVVVLVYGGIMNPASVLMYQPNPNWNMILTAYITGFPADIVHGGATAMFLWFLSQSMLAKLERVKVKYGLMERE